MAKKHQSYLGVDLGGGGIKIVELKKEGKRARLVNYAYTNQVSRDGSTWIENKDQAADLLKKLLAKAKIQTKEAVGGLLAQNIFDAIFTMPKGKDQETAEAAKAQVAKLSGKNLSDLVVDWKIVPQEEGGAEKKESDSKNFVRVYATAADRTLVAAYSEIFSLAGLKLLSLETELFALIRALIGKDKSVALVIDMGSSRTNIFIVENGIPTVSRSIKVGGNSITEILEKNLNLPRETAEKLKRDASLINNFPEGQSFPQIFKDALEPLTNEIKFFLDNYFSANQGAVKIDKVILTGGSAGLPNFSEYLSKRFNLRVFLGDPWARVLYPESLRPLLDSLGSRLAVAVGLALHEIED